MESSKWWNRRDFLPGYGIFALLAFLLGMYLSWGNQSREAGIESMRAANEGIRAFAAQPVTPTEPDFLRRAFPAERTADYSALLESVGLSVTDVSEAEGERSSLGRFQKIFISGTGSFAQILRGFDIIQSEERWNAVYLKDIKRGEKGLAFEIEIRTFQYRGTYEEEKYRPDRSHGNREEPRRQDTL